MEKLKLSQLALQDTIVWERERERKRERERERERERICMHFCIIETVLA